LWQAWLLALLSHLALRVVGVMGREVCGRSSSCHLWKQWLIKRRLRRWRLSRGEKEEQVGGMRGRIVI
jgi:hypothetical protein